MINFGKTVQEIKDRLGMTCHGDLDASHLIAAADAASRDKMRVLSAEPQYVHTLWSWLEKTDLDIYAKITEGRGNQTQESFAERLSEKINTAFKSGAHGVQIFVDKQDLDFFVSALFPVKEDLFYGRKLFFCLDIQKIDNFDWEDIFYQINKIGASGILLDKGKTRPRKNTADDIVGRLHGLFDFMGPGFSGDIHFVGFNVQEVESAWRLANRMRPEIVPRLIFFLDDDFYKVG